jgi:hypothetical protein
VQTYAELLTVAGAYTPDHLRKAYQKLCFSGMYAFYGRPGSLSEVAPKYVQLSHHSTDGSGWFLLYIGLGRKTSEKRFLGVRCQKHCRGLTYEAQSQLRLGLCGVLFESWNLEPCFKPNKKDARKKFIWLRPEQKARLTKWCDDNVLLEFVQASETPVVELDHLDDDETTLIQRYLPLLNTECSNHPFTPELRRLKRAFSEDGLKRPYPKP